MGFQRSQISKMSLSEFLDAWNDGFLDQSTESLAAGNFDDEHAELRDARKKKTKKKMKNRVKSPKWNY